MAEEPRGERLQKILSRAGIASRRAAEELIRAGRVTIGDRIAVLGDRVGLDVLTAAPARYGCDLRRLDRRTAAAWIAELTQQVLVGPAGAALS